MVFRQRIPSTWVVALSIPLLAVASGCGGSGKKSNSPSDNLSPVSTDETQPVEFASLTPAGATGYALNTLSSSLMLPSGPTAALVGPSASPILSLLADANNDGFDDGLIPSSNSDANSTQSTDLPNCDLNAAALATPTKKLSHTDPTYPKATLDCLLNHPGSADAVAGNIGLVNGILCAVEKNLGAPMEFSEAGKDYGTLNLLVSEECFSKDFVTNTKKDMGDNPEIPIAVTTKLAPNDPFPQHIALVAGDRVNLRIKMLVTADVFAFVKSELGEGDTEDSPRDVISVTVDRGTGVLRFAKRNSRWGDVWTGILHGQFGSNGQIESIDGIDVHKVRFGYPTGEGNDNTPSQRTSFNAEILTARGDNANGITYALQQYRCPAIGGDSTDCYNPANGVFDEPVVTCVARGSESCQFEPTAFAAADVPYMAIFEHFNTAPSSYSNPQQQALENFFTRPEPMCFSTPPKNLDPDVDCRQTPAAALALASSAAAKKVFLTRTAQNPASERRISDWASACGVKQGKIDLQYSLGSSAKTPGNLIASVGNGSGHALNFGIITGFGKFATDYNITMTLRKNGDVIASKDLVAPTDGSQPANESIPFSLGGLQESDNLTVDFRGTFRCKVNAGISARNNVAYSMSWGPGALRVTFNGQ